MTTITVRALHEEDWRDYKAVRLAALKDSPQSFQSTYEEEERHDEQQWRACMTRAQRLLAEDEEEHRLGVVSVGLSNSEEEAAEVFGLWVAPEARKGGVAWLLVEAAAAEARNEDRTHLYYWVGNDNGRAIGFASNFGFRPTSRRRQPRVSNDQFGDSEIALVLSLAEDPGAAVGNPSGPHLGFPDKPSRGSGDG